MHPHRRVFTIRRRCRTIRRRAERPVSEISPMQEANVESNGPEQDQENRDRLSGGGSHTAFTAGVLSIVLSPEYADRFDLIGFSGTSGGAVCTTLAWSGLISDAPDPRAEAVQRLQAFWDELKADTPFDLARNFWGLFTVRLPVVAE